MGHLTTMRTAVIRAASHPPRLPNPLCPPNENATWSLSRHFIRVSFKHLTGRRAGAESWQRQVTTASQEECPLGPQRSSGRHLALELGAGLGPRGPISPLKAVLPEGSAWNPGTRAPDSDSGGLPSRLRHEGDGTAMCALQPHPHPQFGSQ